MPEHGEPLTEREAELLQLVATGATNRQIGHALHISVNTVKVHVRNILAKLGASSRTEATMIAIKEGWVIVEGAEEPRGDDVPPAASSSPGAAAEDGGTADAVAPTQPPSPPLPWPKRIALIAVPLLLAAVLVAMPTEATAPQTALRDDLPPDPPQEQSLSDGVESADSRWHRRAQMPTPRAYLALASVGGRLVAIGGRTPEGVTPAVEIYDPEADIWLRGQDKPTPAGYVSAAAIGSQVYVPGGCDSDFVPSQTVEVYTVETDSWESAGPLPAPRCAYAIAAREGEVLVIGGWDGEGYVATVYAYDPAMDRWSEIAPLAEPRGFAAATTLDGRVYAAGGYDGQRELTACALLDPSASAWQPCPPLTVGRGGLGLVALGRQLFAVGGGGWQSYLGFSERFDPTTSSWHPVETPLIGEWRSPGLGVVDYTIYAVGGWSGGYLSLNQAYDLLPYRIFIPVSEAQ